MHVAWPRWRSSTRKCIAPSTTLASRATSSLSSIIWFYAQGAVELLKQAAWIANRVNGVIERYIGRLPRRRLEILPVPDERTPSYTHGRGGGGHYLVNTCNAP